VIAQLDELLAAENSPEVTDEDEGGAPRTGKAEQSHRGVVEAPDFGIGRPITGLQSRHALEHDALAPRGRLPPTGAGDHSLSARRAELPRRDGGPRKKGDGRVSPSGIAAVADFKD
jgi:hypothetical protein